MSNIDIKDAGDVTVPVSTVDKTAAGNGELQLFGLDYGAGTARQHLTEKPATEAAQATAIATLLDLLAAIQATLTIGGTVAISNLPATQPVSGPLTDAQLRAAAVDVDLLDALKTPSGALRVGNTKTKLRDEFPTGGLKSALWDLIATGSGMNVATGNGTTGSYLLISSGTTINSETIIRSKDIFTLPARFAAFVTASQRIANQEFFVELIEVDAAGAPVVGTSQTNAGTAPNYAGVKFDGIVATECRVAVRSGGAPEFLSAASTVQTSVATGGSPNWFPAGMVELQITGEHVQLLQAAIDVTTAATPARRITQAAPDPEALYKLQIRARNLGTAPASTTDWRVHAIRLFDYTRLDVSVIGGTGHSGAGSAVAVNVAGGALGITGNPNVAGQAAHDAVVAGNPILNGLEARNTLPAAVSASGDVARQIGTMSGVPIQRPYSIPEATWTANIALTNTTAQVLAAAAGAGLKRHMTALQLMNTGAAVVEAFILDGAAERWRMPLPINVPVPIPFPTELNVTANTALNINLSAAGTVRACAQGHTGP
jgi:hypothetical protein